jgi:hypothetical protein
MGKLAGRWVQTQIDDAGGTPQDVSSDIDSVDIPDEYGELDVTGFMEGGDNSIPGMPSSPVEMTGSFNPAANKLGAVAIAILGSYTSKTIIVDVGNNAAPVQSDRRFTGEFWLQALRFSSTPKGKNVVRLSFKPMGSVAPGWTTKP